MPSFCRKTGGRESGFALDITRDQIKEAKGKSLHLNDDLVAWIKAEIKPAAVWKSSGMTRRAVPAKILTHLSDRDWPFDSQLELAKLRSLDRDR